MRPHPKQRTLILFGRFPQLGRGKRRLAAEIGDGPAHRWARSHLAACCRRLYAPHRWQLVLAVEGAPATWSAPRGLAWFDQSRAAGYRKDLGRRMLASLAAFAPQPVVLVGSDILGVEQSDIAELFSELERPGSLLAPARDGGFWALGHRGPARALAVLDTVGWSRADTCQSVQRALGARLIPLLKSDVDRASDLLGSPQGSKLAAKMPRITA